jgi:hypothetical protein
VLKGDVHRFYLSLRRDLPAPDHKPIPHLQQVREIATYYAGISPDDRRLLLAWAKKEESGLGLIPTALSGIPLLGLLFAPFIQAVVRGLSPHAWALIWAIGAIFFLAGIYIHFRQRAFTALHIQVLEYSIRAEEHEDRRAKPVRFRALSLYQRRARQMERSRETSSAGSGTAPPNRWV